MAAAGLVLLAFALVGPAHAIPPTVPCTFTVSPARGAHIVCSLDGKSWKSVGAGQTTRLLAGNWRFRVSAQGYQTINSALRISGASFSHSFTLKPLAPPSVRCPICGDEFPNKAALDKHRLHKHTWVKVLAIEPSDAGLRLDDSTPITADQQVKVSPGSHSITSKLAADFRYPFTVKLGERKTIARITVPENDGRVKVMIEPQVASVEIKLVDAERDVTYKVVLSREQRLPPGSYVIGADLPDGYYLADTAQTVDVGKGGSVKDVLVRILKTVPACDICLGRFETQAAVDQHMLDKHTWVMVTKVDPSDAELNLEDGAPIKPGQQVKVSPGRHSITGESPRGYLEKPYEFTMAVGHEETIALITVPDGLPPSVTIGKVDPPEAKITVNGRPAKAGSTVEVRPEGSANSVKVSVVVEADDYSPWTMDRELKWKGEPWTLPDVKLPRLVYGNVTLSVNPPEAEESARVVLVDEEGQAHAITLKPEGVRLPPGKYASKAEATDYREKKPGSTVIVEDHQTTPVLVEFVKVEGRLMVSYQPQPVAAVSVYEAKDALVPGSDGSWLLSPDITHSLVFKALGFEDAKRSVTLGSNVVRTLEVTMKPLPGIVKLNVEPNDALIEITADGKVIKTDKSDKAERTIQLSPGEDGSDKVHQYRVFRDGFAKDLFIADCQGDFTVERGKTISLPGAVVLKLVRLILQEGTLDMSDLSIRPGLKVEELLRAAVLADSPDLSDKFVKHGWGLKWHDMAEKFRERAANLKLLQGCVMENHPCMPREDLTVETLRRAVKLAETLSIRDNEVRPGCGCTWGTMAKEFRKKAADASSAGGSK